MRPVALGRKNWLFMGSKAGGKSAAIAHTLIETAKMNEVNPEAWLAWVLKLSKIIPSTASQSCCLGPIRT